MTDKRYQVSTYVCIAIAVFDVMAGITIVNIYAATIFENIVKEGGTMFVRVPTAGIFIGVSGFIGAFFQLYCLLFQSKRSFYRW